MHLNQLKFCKNATTKQIWGTCDNGEEAKGLELVQKSSVVRHARLMVFVIY